MSKARSEQSHAQKRALQRAGVFYSFRDLAAMARLIQTGQSQALRAQSLARVVHQLDFRKRRHIVVYNKRTKQIVTFLDGLDITQDDS